MPVTRKGSGGTARDQLDSLRMVFRIPDGAEGLESLRDALLMNPFGISQTRRLRIAREIAKSVSYLHTFKFVHKNIRPESVLCFERNQEVHTFLVKFDAFRSADGSTNLCGDEEWDRNVYRHPRRQGLYLTEPYRMEHDMYSLGVCLPEIGLCESFVQYVPNGPVMQAVVGKWYADMQPWLQGHTPSSHQWPGTIKDYLMALAKSTLPVRMGDKYSSAVVACLTSLDGVEDHGVGGGEMKVAVKFIEEILFLLDDIST